MARKMRAYGENEHPGKYVLDDYRWSRNHHKAVAIRRWKRHLKKKARSYMRQRLHKEMDLTGIEPVSKNHSAVLLRA